MVIKIKQSIKNAKSKAQFNKREKDRFKRKNKGKNFENKKFVDKKQLKE